MEISSILRLPRWQPLAAFVEHWHVESLGATGIDTAELEKAEARLGRALPVALREWYQLVGHRFVDVNQDQAVPLHELAIRGDRLPVWWENQGCWSIDVELSGAEADPWASVDTEEESWQRRDRLSRALLGMVYSDTMVGVWSGRGVGPLGSLKAEVVGGYQEDVSADMEAGVAALPQLDVFTNPYFPDPWRGDSDLVVRGEQSHYEWMAASYEAAKRAETLLDLIRPDASRVLVIVLSAAVASDRSTVSRLVNDRDGAMFGGLARLKSARLPGGDPLAVLELEARDPDAALTQLRTHLSPTLLASMTAGHRPQAVMRFVPAWPPELREFRPPR